LEHLYSEEHTTTFSLAGKTGKNFGSKSFKTDVIIYMFNWASRPIHLTLGPDEHFFMESAREGGKWVFWVCYLGTFKEAEKFEVRIRICAGTEHPGNGCLVQWKPLNVITLRQR
jgi:hypothetical protein